MDKNKSGHSVVWGISGWSHHLFSLKCWSGRCGRGECQTSRLDERCVWMKQEWIVRCLRFSGWCYHLFSIMCWSWRCGRAECQTSRLDERCIWRNGQQQEWTQRCLRYFRLMSSPFLNKVLELAIWQSWMSYIKVRWEMYLEEWTKIRVDTALSEVFQADLITFSH